LKKYPLILIYTSMKNKIIFCVLSLVLQNELRAQLPFDVNGYWQHSDANQKNIVPENGTISYFRMPGANDDIRSCQKLTTDLPTVFKLSFTFAVTQVNYEGAALIPIAFTAGNLPISNPDKQPALQTYQDALGILFQTPHKNNRILQITPYLKQKDKPFIQLYKDYIKLEYNVPYNIVLQRCNATSGNLTVYSYGKLIGNKVFTIPANLQTLRYVQASNMVQASSQRGSCAYAKQFAFTTSTNDLCGNTIPDVKLEVPVETPPIITPTETAPVYEPSSNTPTTSNPNATIKVGNRVFTNPNLNSTGGCCIMQTGSINNYIGGMPDLEGNYNVACFQHNTLNYAFKNGIRLDNGYAKWQGPDRNCVTEFTNNIATKRIEFENTDRSQMFYTKESYIDLGDGKNNLLKRTLYTIEFFYSKKKDKPDSAIGYAGADKSKGYQTIIYNHKKNNITEAVLKNSVDGSVQNYKVTLDTKKYNRLHSNYRINYYVGLQTFTSPNLLFTINGFSGDQVNDITPVDNIGKAQAYHFDYTYIKENVKTYITSIRCNNGMKLDFTYECQKLVVTPPITKVPPIETPPTIDQPDVKIEPNKEIKDPIKILPPPIKVNPTVIDTIPKVYADLLTTDMEKLFVGKWKKVNEYELEYHFDYDWKPDSIAIVNTSVCGEDDFVEFRTDFTYGDILGPIPCKNLEGEEERRNRIGTWAIEKNTNNLALKIGKARGDFTIHKLTENELVYRRLSEPFFDKSKNKKIRWYLIYRFTR
jgi:hypothetical protein